MNIKITKVSLTIGRNLNRGAAKQVRSYLGNLFWDEQKIHNHKPDGSFIYCYPRVQYKIIDGACLLIGFEEGVELVKRAFYDLGSLNLNGRWEEILSSQLETYTASLSLVPEPIAYSFLTPWLALNEKNYTEYQQLDHPVSKKKFLERILTGNIISLSKSVGYTVPTAIAVNIERIRTVKTSLKAIPMLGFKGSFSANFEIPDHWGIGKSVSRGFGTLVQINKTNDA